MISRRVWIGLLGLLAASCAVHPLVPTPEATATLGQVRVAVITVTPSATLAPPTTAPTHPATATLAASPTVAVVQPRPTAVNLLPVATDPPPPAAVPPVVLAPPPSADVAAAEQYTIDLINAQRAAVGVAPLQRDETLMGISRARVADMVARNYIGHFDPVTGDSLGRIMIRAAGYTSSYLGENWYGSVHAPPALVETAMQWFMDDPPHAHNILSPNYAAVGVGIAFNGQQWLLVQDFVGK